MNRRKWKECSNIHHKLLPKGGSLWWILAIEPRQTFRNPRWALRGGGLQKSVPVRRERPILIENLR